MCYNYITYCPEHDGPDEDKRGQTRFQECKNQACRGAIQDVPVPGKSACTNCVEKSRGRLKQAPADQRTGRPTRPRDARSFSPTTQRLAQEEYRDRSRSNSPALGRTPSLQVARVGGVSTPARQLSPDQPDPATLEQARWIMLQSLVETRLTNERNELRAPWFSIAEAGRTPDSDQTELYFCEANRNPRRGPGLFLNIGEFDFPTEQEAPHPFTYKNLAANYPDARGIRHRWHKELAKRNIKEPEEWECWRVNPTPGTEEARYCHARRQVADWPLPLPYEPYHWFEVRMQLLGRTDMARHTRQWWWTQDKDESLQFPNTALDATLQAKAKTRWPSYVGGKGSGSGYGGPT